MFRQIKQSFTLSGMDEGEAKATALLLLEKVCGMTQTDVLMGNEKWVGHENKLTDMTRRIANSEPIQYVLGETDFCGMTFHVEPGVLIPRPETEEIVHAVSSTIIPTLTIQNSKLSILDIGTGSGCIAISLAKMHLEASVEAWDISDDALRIAKENAKCNNVNIDFKKIDVLNTTTSEKQFSLIISNPPYICQEEEKDMEARVLDHEPHLALFVPNDDPLLFYRKIAGLALHILYNKGALVFEINRRFGIETANMLQDMGFCNVEVTKDMYGNDRMVKAIKP